MKEREEIKKIMDNLDIEEMARLFKKRMAIPPKSGRNAGKPRTPRNIYECAWQEFAYYPRPTRNSLTNKLLNAAGLNSWDGHKENQRRNP